MTHRRINIAYLHECKYRLAMLKQIDVLEAFQVNNSAVSPHFLR